MVEQIFTQEAVEKLQPYIQKTVDDLLEDLKQKRCADGPVHLVKIFALPAPSYVGSRLKYRLKKIIANPHLGHLHNPWVTLP
jgi:cytochrome P450